MATHSFPAPYRAVTERLVIVPVVLIKLLAAVLCFCSRLDAFNSAVRKQTKDAEFF